MQVILLERVAKLGQMGDVVDVKPGYARNFLLPQGKAKSASEINIAAFESEKAKLEAHNLETKKEADVLAAKLNGQKFTIIRSASATAVDGIILPQTGSARINSDTIKTSAGAIFSIPIAKVDHLKDAIYQLQACDIKTVGMSEKAENTVYQENISGPLALVMGSEEKGITKSTLAILDITVKLPMLGTISSLNVSVACGTVLYEVVRQRNFT